MDNEEAYRMNASQFGVSGMGLRCRRNRRRAFLFADFCTVASCGALPNRSGCGLMDLMSQEVLNVTGLAPMPQYI